MKYLKGKVIKNKRGWLNRGKKENRKFSEMEVNDVKVLKTSSDSFKNRIEDDALFIDKTLLIHEIIRKKEEVQIFTRPRRFGKTTNLSMLECFFDITKKDENRKLFNGLKIENTESMEYFGKYPVVKLTFKDVKQTNAQGSFSYVRELIVNVYDEHRYLFDNLDEGGKEYFLDILNRNKEVNLGVSLLNLMKFLSNYHNEKVVILIDEYDTPLITAYVKGYYDEVIDFYRVLYSSVLKNNKYLKFGIITGINRVSKEGLFSGLNNVRINSVLSDEFTEYFGFTEDEVKKTLKEYELEKNFENVRFWYNGYSFGGQRIYNPWSFTKYLDEKRLKAYWVNSGGDDEIRKLLAEVAGQEMFDDFEKLLLNKTISVKINENVKFKNLKTTEQLWNLLLNAGYLTAEEEGFEGKYKLRIPNYEIASYFRDLFIDEYLNEKPNFSNVLEALVYGDLEMFEKELRENVLNSVSFMENYKESFYQGYFTGLFSGLRGYYYVKGNQESGHGRFDLYLEPKDKKGYGYIIELKVSKRLKDMQREAEEAVEQIKRMEYFQELVSRDVERIDLIGIAFYKKKFKMVKEKVR
jgi:hypothetical protein